MSNLNKQLNQHCINEMKKTKRLEAEIQGHLLPRLSYVLTMNNFDLIKEQIFLAVAGLEELLNINNEKE